MQGMRAQSLMEYVLLVTVIVSALVVMYPRVKRINQSLMKSAADQIGDQAGAEQNFNDDRTGYLVGSNTIVCAAINNLRWDVNGVVDSVTQEVTAMTTSTFINAGFVPD